MLISSIPDRHRSRARAPPCYLLHHNRHHQHHHHPQLHHDHGPRRFTTQCQARRASFMMKWNAQQEKIHNHVATPTPLLPFIHITIFVSPQQSSAQLACFQKSRIRGGLSLDLQTRLCSPWSSQTVKKDYSSRQSLHCRYSRSHLSLLDVQFQMARKSLEH